jgi:branched-chain amino acid transport system substrate-binding protein
VAGMNRLITIHDTQAVLSSFSGPTVAIAPISEDKGIFVLNGGGVSLKMVGVSKYMFHNRSLATDLAGAIIRRAKELNATKVSQIAQKNEFGDSVIQASNEAAKGLGLAVAGVEQFATDATNIDTQIAKLRTSRPDAVANWPTTPHAGLVVKRMRELGMTQPVLSMEWTPEDTKVAGANPGHVEVVTDYFAPSEDNPMSRRFHDAYKAKYGDTPDFYAANYYEAVYVIAECIRRAKAEGGDYWSGRRLTEALWQNPTFDSVYGKTMTFQKNGVTLKRVGLFQLEGQSLKFLKFIDTSN